MLVHNSQNFRIYILCTLVRNIKVMKLRENVYQRKVIDSC